MLDLRGNAKICDFGLSCKLAKDATLDETCGGPLYRAPEMIENTYNHSVDFWSLGILIFYMIAGSFPYEEQSDIETQKDKIENLEDKILNDNLPDINEKGKLIGPQFVNVSESGCDFVMKLLNKNPVKRLGSGTNSQEIRNHAFFNGIDWNRLEKGEIDSLFKPDVMIFLI